MDINYELDKYKIFYKMYKEVIRGLTDDYDYDIAIDNTDYDDSNSKVTLKIYKSDYNYATRDELIRLYNNGELFIYSNSVILNDYLSFNLVNLIRDNFILGHDILLPFFDKNGNQVLRSKTNTLYVKINSQDDLKMAQDIHYSIIKRKTKNN